MNFHRRIFHRYVESSRRSADCVSANPIARWKVANIYTKSVPGDTSWISEAAGTVKNYWRGDTAISLERRCDRYAGVLWLGPGE